MTSRIASPKFPDHAYAFFKSHRSGRARIPNQPKLTVRSRPRPVLSRIATSLGPKKARASSVPEEDTPAETIGSGFSAFAAGSPGATGRATGKSLAVAACFGTRAIRK